LKKFTPLNLSAIQQGAIKSTASPIYRGRSSSFNTGRIDHLYKEEIISPRPQRPQRKNNYNKFFASFALFARNNKSELLLEKVYIVHGIIRRASTFNTKRIDHLYKEEIISPPRPVGATFAKMKTIKISTLRTLPAPSHGDPSGIMRCECTGAFLACLPKRSTGRREEIINNP